MSLGVPNTDTVNAKSCCTKPLRGMISTLLVGPGHLKTHLFEHFDFVLLEECEMTVPGTMLQVLLVDNSNNIFVLLVSLLTVMHEHQTKVVLIS